MCLQSTSGIIYVRSSLGPFAQQIKHAGGVIEFLQKSFFFEEIFVPHFYGVRPVWRPIHKHPKTRNSGALGENIAAYPQSVISRHPTHSFAGVGHRVSEILRKYFTANALHSIYENPIMGDYGSYLAKTGVGTESHNLLSAWVDLGMFGFLYLSIILLRPAWHLFYYGYFLKVKTCEFLFAGILISSTLMLLIISKNFTYMGIGAALGAYANYRSGKNCNTSQGSNDV